MKEIFNLHTQPTQANLFNPTSLVYAKSAYYYDMNSPSQETSFATMDDGYTSMDDEYPTITNRYLPMDNNVISMMMLIKIQLILKRRWL